MSVDGFVTGPGADLEYGLGRDAEGLHAWALESQDPVDRHLLQSLTASTGAVVMGRKTFDTVDGPGGWNESMGYGADQAARPPFFVVTSAQPEQVRRPARTTSRSCWTVRLQRFGPPGRPPAIETST